MGARHRAARTVGAAPRRAARPSAFRTLGFGALVGLAFATAFIVSGLIGLSASAELYVGFACLLALGVGVVGILGRGLIELRMRLEGLAFEIVTANSAVAKLQAEAGMLREVVNAMSIAPPQPQRSVSRKLEFGTLGDRPCARMGDGTIIVETLVGYRRFESEADAEAFVGTAGFRPTSEPGVSTGSRSATR